MNSLREPALQSIRVLLVGQHAVIRTSLRLLIESRPGLTVVGEASSCAEIAKSSLPQCDIVLLEIDLDRERSLDSMAELIASSNQRVLILAGESDDRVCCDAMRLGAMGLVLKEKPAEDLIKAIQKVHAGEVWFDRSMMAHMLNTISRRPAGRDEEAERIATLTDREREIVTLVGEGLKPKQIGERLFISEITVRHHLTSTFSKLGVSDRFELLIYAYRHKLAKLPL